MRNQTLMRWTLALGLVCLVGMQTGCGSANSLKPTFVKDPQITIDAVQRLAVSEAGSQYEIVLTLTNPNEEPLPLTEARYTLVIGGESYSTATNPNAEVPVGRPVTIRLPAALAGAGNDFSLSGSIVYQPLGQFREVMTDIGLPLPSKGFKSAGQVVDQAVTVAVPAPGEAIVPQPDALPLARERVEETRPEPDGE